MSTLTGGAAPSSSPSSAWSGGVTSNGGLYRPAALHQALCRAVLQRLTPAGEAPILSAVEANYIEARSVTASSRMPSSEVSQLANSRTAGWSKGSAATPAASSTGDHQGTLDSSGMWAIEIETSLSNADGVYHQHIPPLIRIPSAELPDVYHQLCATMWNAVKVAAEDEETRQKMLIDSESTNDLAAGYRISGNDLYCSMCEGVWDVLSIGADPPRGMEEVWVGESMNAVRAQHMPDLVFPRESITSLYSSLCEGVWEILSGILTEDQEVLLAHYEAVPPIAQHLPALTCKGPPLVMKTAPPRKPPPKGCYHVHPVVPRMYHSLLGMRPLVNGRGVRLPPLEAVRSVSEENPHDDDSWACETVERQRSESSTAPNAAGMGVAWMPFLFRDECVEREKIFWEMIRTSLSLFPWPVNPLRRQEVASKSKEERRVELLQHPAMVAGQEAIAVVEAFQRRQIFLEEEEGRNPIRKAFIYELRLLTIGTKPLEDFCRCWIFKYRGRKAREAQRRRLIIEREGALRVELQETDASLRERWVLLHAALDFFEQSYRRQIEMLQVRAFYVLGTIAVRLEEQVALFPLLYGGTMRRTCGFARISGTTVFVSLALTEAAWRLAIQKEEENFSAALPYEVERTSLVDIFEPAARRALEQEEFAARASVEYRLFQQVVYYRNRDVEIYRAVEFDVNVERPTAAKLCGKDIPPDPFE